MGGHKAVELRGGLLADSVMLSRVVDLIIYEEGFKSQCRTASLENSCLVLNYWLIENAPIPRDQIAVKKKMKSEYYPC